ncbi:hypothetical protein [Phocaeicola coprocola]|uniref:hypothetical protein n=1 Tax=Phocaeicola coprocola TaxID=310298 RepID=UPI001E07DD7B|nr:hypothetical protein [Phocaeicola plebeius]
MSYWFQYANDLAKAERELKIEQWVEVTIYYGYAEKQVSLYHYNLPSEMYFRYQWVIRWRMAKLQCQYPKQIVSTSLYFYDKRSGESLEVSSCLSKLISVKAQVTKAERMMKNYIEQNRQNNMFFDEYTDEELVKFREKLDRKKLECAECEKRLELLVERRRSNQ